MAEEDSLGRRIRRSREALHLTRKQLGRRVGRSERTVYDWENNRTVPKNRLGALEEVFGHRLDGGQPDIPALFARNWEFPQTQGIWNAPGLSVRERLRLLTGWLRENHPERLGDEDQALGAA